MKQIPPCPNCGSRQNPHTCQQRRQTSFTASLVARNVRSTYRPVGNAAALSVESEAMREVAVTIAEQASVIYRQTRRGRVQPSEFQLNPADVVLPGTVRGGPIHPSENGAQFIPAYDQRSPRSPSAFANVVGMAPRQHLAEARLREQYRVASEGTEMGASRDDRWATQVIAHRSEIPSHSPMALPPEIRRLRGAGGRDFTGADSANPVATAERADRMRRELALLVEGNRFLGVAQRETRPEFRPEPPLPDPKGETLPRLAGRPI